MEAYQFYTKEPVRKIEDIIIYDAMPAVFEEIIHHLKKENKTVQKRDVLDNISSLASKGMMLLGNKGQESKKIYELLHGCILAAFLNSVEKESTHYVCYPEDESYDFLILRHPRTKAPDFRQENKEIYRKGSVFKVEFTQAITDVNIKSTILNKLDNTHDYKGRILLVGISFPSGYVSLQDLSNELMSIKQDNFQTIWLLGQTDDPNDPKKLCFLLAELIKHRKVVSLFDLPINWNRIRAEINDVLV